MHQPQRLRYTGLMAERVNNFAYIDGQNLHKGMQGMGWKLDYGRFRVYLAQKYQVTQAFLFLGYLPNMQPLYNSLQAAGFILVFKPVAIIKGEVKGNVDGDLIVKALVDIAEYDQAVIVSSDGDYYSLVRHLYDQKKLRIVLSPYHKTCSLLIKKEAKEKINFIHYVRQKLEYKDRT